jgi:hypothetical protein
MSTKARNSSVEQAIAEANARAAKIAPQGGIVSKEQVQAGWDHLSDAERDGFRQMGWEPTKESPGTQDAKQVAEQIAKATRLKGVEVELTAKVPRITIDGRTLAYVRPQKKSIRLHIQNWGPEQRVAATTVAEAAKLVRTSERRKPRPKK